VAGVMKYHVICSDVNKFGTPMLKLPKKRNKNHLLDIDLNALIKKKEKSNLLRTPIFFVNE